MADRCLAGEFEGSSSKAAQEPECVLLGVLESAIRYHMDNIDPAAAAARATGRKRAATEAAAAEATGVPVKIIFVERAGSAAATAAVEAAMSVIESHMGVRVESVANCARAEAATPLQAEIEVEAERTEELEAELDALKVRDAAQRLEGVASAARIAALEAQLALAGCLSYGADELQ